MTPLRLRGFRARRNKSTYFRVDEGSASPPARVHIKGPKLNVLSGRIISREIFNETREGYILNSPSHARKWYPTRSLRRDLLGIHTRTGRPRDSSALVLRPCGPSPPLTHGQTYLFWFRSRVRHFRWRTWRYISGGIFDLRGFFDFLSFDRCRHALIIERVRTFRYN